MIIKRHINSLYEENTYVLINDKDAIMIDPGSDKEEIELLINGYKLKAILITHYHEDHTYSLDYFKNKYKVNVIDYKSAENINIENFKFNIIKTYGHTDDSVTFYFKDDKIMFTGDFLFKGSIGRYDFNNSSYDDMKESIKIIKAFDKDIVLYPGHDEKTTLKEELENNYYLK